MGELIEASGAGLMLEPLTLLAVQAGAAILAIDHDAMNIAGKGDGTPVTEADLAADRIIREGLARLAPGVPILSEESVASFQPPLDGSSFFVVDPLDGTKEFVAGRNEYTVNMALVTSGVPVLGVIAAPALGLLWRGVVGRGAERVQIEPPSPRPPEAIRTRAMPEAGRSWVAAVSRSHGDPRSEAFIAARAGAVRLALGSAVKFCRLAEGDVDVYPRLAPTSEWDVAAGHALVTAAGGKITDSNGAPLRFGAAERGFIVPEFIAWGDASAAPY